MLFQTKPKRISLLRQVSCLYKPAVQKWCWSSKTNILKSILWHQSPEVSLLAAICGTSYWKMTFSLNVITRRTFSLSSPSAPNEALWKYRYEVFWICRQSSTIHVDIFLQINLCQHLLMAASFLKKEELRRHFLTLNQLGLIRVTSILCQRHNYSQG